MFVVDDRVSPEAAERIRALVEEVRQEIARAEAGDIPVSVAVGFYRPPTWTPATRHDEDAAIRSLLTGASRRARSAAKAIRLVSRSEISRSTFLTIS